jgi:thymidylate kinase
MGDRIHGFLLERVYPRPRGPIFLDAPPDVLYARKPEGSPAAVEARHREYLDVVRVLPDVTVVDAARGEEEVLAELLELVHRGAAPGDAAGGSWARHEDDGSSPPALGQEG